MAVLAAAKGPAPLGAPRLSNASMYKKKRKEKKRKNKEKKKKKRKKRRNTDLRRWELRQKARPAQAIDQISRTKLLISE